MAFASGDLVSVNTPYGRRELITSVGSVFMNVHRGTHAIVIEEVAGKWNSMFCKILVGGTGVWFVESDLISKVRLEFRSTELWELARLKLETGVGQDI